MVSVESLRSQVDKILVVDNASTNPESLSFLNKLSNDLSATIIFNDINFGIAFALNQGITFAAEGQYDWILTLDQDSLAPVDYLQTMFRAYESCDEKESVAIISPVYQTSTGLISFATNFSESSDYSIVKTTMTSGNLVKTVTFQKVGLFDESFFMDFVDHEFCLRIRSNKLLILESHKSILVHSLGDSKIHEFIGLKVVTSGHSPLRRYYKYRNMVKTLKAYYWFDFLALAKDFKSLLFEPAKILLFEVDKVPKLTSIFKGIIDGLKEVS